MAAKRWKPRFIESLKQLGNVLKACEAAGIARSAVYAERADDKEFAQQWADAMEEAADVLELEARRRAVEGVDEPIYHQGKAIDTVRKYSDVLLIFLLKGARPHKFRDNVHHSGDAIKSEPIVLVHTAPPPKPASNKQ